jgi:hypothetical protein
VPGAAARIAATCTGHDDSTPGKPQADGEDPAAGDGLVSARVNDATALVAALQDAELDERAQAAVALLALVAARTWSRPRVRMGPMGAGGSPAGSPPTG